MSWKPADLASLLDDPRRGFLILMGCAVVVLLVQLGAPPLWGAEGRWACVAREMIQSGNYFTPTINGQLYYDKPIFSYWVVVFFSWIFGGVSEWTVRLPSVAAGLLAIWATVRIGDRLLGSGLLAGWILLSTTGLMRGAHWGTSDWMAASLVISAAWAFIEGTESGRRGYIFAFWVFMALASQAKGLTGFIVPGMVAVAYLLATRTRRISPWHAAGFVLGSMVYLGPFLVGPAGSEGLELVLKENVLRFFEPFDHKDPVSIYFKAVPEYLLPWTFLIVPASIWTWKHWRHLSPGIKWNLYSTAAVLVFFSLSGSRREHYIMPFLPFTVLWLAAFLKEKSGRVAIRGTAILLLLTGVGLAAAPLFIDSRFQAYVDQHVATRWILASAVLIAGGVSLARPDRWVFALMTIVLWAVFWWGVLPAIETENVELKEFARQVRAQVPDGKVPRFAIYGMREARFIYYFDASQPIPYYDTDPDLPRMYWNEIDRVILAPEFLNLTKQQYGAEPTFVLRQKQFPWMDDDYMFKRSLVYVEFFGR